ncbi:glycosyltransferase family 4 protein [Akkermansiaceae bacterium]|nr:glycosyltransferase family 4 protein [Akkermansiaceae bacterium]
MTNHSHKHPVIKVARVATVPFSHRANQDMYGLLTEMGVEVTVVCSRTEEFEDIEKWSVKQVYEVPISREIAPLRDLISIWKLMVFVRKNKPDILHSSTPKGGLVCAFAGWLCRVPVRIHTFTGQRWATLSGVKKWILMTCEWLVGRLSTHLYADSPSQVQFLVQSKIAPKDKITCLGIGSFGGIDTKRFKPGFKDDKLRDSLGFSPDDFVFVFVGRINSDKGINELAYAFSKLIRDIEEVKLLLVGPFEQDLNPIAAESYEFLKSNPKVKCAGLVDKPEKYLALSDVMVFPSYREGFPTVILEAAAMEVPTIGTDIVGGKDTIIDGETGVLIPSHDQEALLQKMLWTLNHRDQLEVMGKAGRKWVCDNFETKAFSKMQFEEYQRILTA